MMRRIIVGVLMAAVFLVGTGVATAADGVLACVGRYLEFIFENRPADSPNQRVGTSFLLSNFNAVATITIGRIVVYDFGGTTLCDSADGSFTGPGAIGPIGPNGGTWFGVNPGNCAGVPDATNYNVKIYWSFSDCRVPFHSVGCRSPLYGKSTIRIMEMDRTDENAVATAEVSRGVSECNSVR